VTQNLEHGSILWAVQLFLVEMGFKLLLRLATCSLHKV
jgi:hypothetical protein